MRKSSRIAALLLAALLAPGAAATWYSYGSYEPSTRFDGASVMFPEAPGAELRRVYFNVFTQSSAAGYADVSPNVASLRSDVEAVGFERHTGILGWWIDCNQDGYIGMAEGALREYPSALLGSNAVCPPVGSINDPPTGKWDGASHNYKGWVVELIPIGGPAARAAGDPLLIKDPEAMVWGDYGKPDFELTRDTCALRPFPRGTTRSTGGMLDYADCRVSQYASDEGDLGSTWNMVAPAGLGLAYNESRGEESWNEPGHPLNVGTFGDASSENAIVKAQDCEQAYLVEFPQGAPAQVAGRGIRPPSTSVNPSGTVPGTFNYTHESLPTNPEPGATYTSDCDPTNDRGDEFYSGMDVVETDFQGVSTRHKLEANWNFNFTTMTRTQNRHPVDGGVFPLGQAMVIGEPSVWEPNSALTKPSMALVRGSAVGGDLDLAAGYYLTFYARVGATTLGTYDLNGPAGKLPAGAYGYESCQGATSGVHNGWNCDRDLWYVNQQTGERFLEYYPFARPGDAYHLRDTDCFDGTLYATEDGSVDAAVGPGHYGSYPCA